MCTRCVSKIPASKGNVSWTCYDLFGGALCQRRSWQMIEAAAKHLWGTECQLTHSFTVTFLKVYPHGNACMCFLVCLVTSNHRPEVEKSRGCVRLTKECFPSSCIFNNILKLVRDPPKTKNWNPAKLTLKKHYECVQHQTPCLISCIYEMHPNVCNIAFLYPGI